MRFGNHRRLLQREVIADRVKWERELFFTIGTILHISYTYTRALLRKSKSTQERAVVGHDLQAKTHPPFPKPLLRLKEM